MIALKPKSRVAILACCCWPLPAPRPSRRAPATASRGRSACWSASSTPTARRAGAPRERPGPAAANWRWTGSRPAAAARTRRCPPSPCAKRWRACKALGLARPLQDAASRRKAQPGEQRLRVAHGLPFGGYIGTSIELKPGRGGALASLAGAGGNAARRHRGQPGGAHAGAQRPATDLGREDTARGKRGRAVSTRPVPCSIPAGADPARLRVVGWVEDTRGRLRGIAASRCTRAARPGVKSSTGPKHFEARFLLAPATALCRPARRETGPQSKRSLVPQRFFWSLVWKSSITTKSCCCRANAAWTAAPSATPAWSWAGAASASRWCRPT